MLKSIKHLSTSKRAILPSNAPLSHTKSVLTAALVIMSLYAVTSRAYGQVESEAEISSNDPEILAIVEEIVADNDNLPGMVAAIYEKGKPLRIAATGVRKLGTDEALTTDNVMHLGSCTKAMTATAIGRLMEQGKIKLDATIEESLPALGKQIHEGYRKVTLSQLLQHRSGMPANAKSWWLMEGDSLSEKRESIAIASLQDAPKHSPGSKYLYSNLGYMIAGLMAAQASGQSWEDLMRTEVFQPLELESAGFGIPGKRGETDEPWGHRTVEGKTMPVQFDNAPALGPAGTVYMTLSDWAKFVRIHLDEAGDYLSEETIRRLHDPGDEGNYALGWGIHPRSWAGGDAISHSGSNTLWYCVVWAAPKKKTAYLVAANAMGEGIPKAADRVAAELIKLNKAN